MKKITITVGSATYAIRLRKLLLRSGIKSTLIKSEMGENNLGCSHGVEISENDLYHAAMIMRENGIKYSVSESKYDIS